MRPSRRVDRLKQCARFGQVASEFGIRRVLWVSVELERSARVVDIEKGERRSASAVDMDPLCGVYVKAVPREQFPPMGRHEVDCRSDEFENGFRDEVVEVDQHPPWLDSLTAEPDFVADLCGVRIVDSEQRVTVWTCTRAPATRLNPEEIIEHSYNEVVMEVLPVVFDDE